VGYANLSFFDAHIGFTTEMNFMEIATILTIIITVIGIYIGWWTPKAAQIRERLRNAEPQLYFATGSYGGPTGHGIGLNLQNQGNVDAYDLAFYLSEFVEPLWKTPILRAGETPYHQIPLTDNSPVRTQPIKGLKARLVYHDRYKREFIASLDLIQQKRADGLYNIVTAPGVSMLG